MDIDSILTRLKYSIEEEILVIDDKEYVENCKGKRKLELINEFQVKINTKKTIATISNIKYNQHRKILACIIGKDMSELVFQTHVKGNNNPLSRSASSKFIKSTPNELEISEDSSLKKISHSLSTDVSRSDIFTRDIPLSPLIPQNQSSTTPFSGKNTLHLGHHKKDVKKMREDICRILCVDPKIPFEYIVFE